MHFLCLSRNIGAGDTAPSEAIVGAAVMAFRFLNGVDRDQFGRAGEQVVEVGFDGVGFVKQSYLPATILFSVAVLT